MTADFQITRKLSVAEADELVGVTVEPRAPDLTEEGVYWDADTGEPVIYYAPYPGDVARFRNALLRVDFQTVTRGGMGWKNEARTFGMAPRKPVMQREACTPTALMRDQPDVHEVLEDAAEVLVDQLDSVLPDIVTKDRENIGQVLPEWRLDEDSVWTSGIINRTSSLPYHRDEMNFHAWSAMPVFRRATFGGFLHCPEYDVTVACRDAWSVYFMGKTLVHGNTPIKLRSRDGYRISVVYYALRGMKDCYSYAAELAEARKRRTERERV